MRFSFILLLLLALTLVECSRRRDRRHHQYQKGHHRRNSRSHYRHHKKGHHSSKNHGHRGHKSWGSSWSSQKFQSRSLDRSISSPAVTSSADRKLVPNTQKKFYRKEQSPRLPDCYLLDRGSVECGHTLEKIINRMKPCYDQTLLKKILDKEVRACRRTNGQWEAPARALVRQRGGKYFLDYTFYARSSSGATIQTRQIDPVEDLKKAISRSAFGPKTRKLSIESKANKESNAKANKDSNAKELKTSNIKIQRSSTFNGMVDENDDFLRSLSQSIFNNKAKVKSAKTAIPKEKPEKKNSGDSIVNAIRKSMIDTEKRQKLKSKAEAVPVPVQVVKAKKIDPIEELKKALVNQMSKAASIANMEKKQEAGNEKAVDKLKNLLLQDIKLESRDDNMTTTTEAPKPLSLFEEVVNKIKEVIKSAVELGRDEDEGNETLVEEEDRELANVFNLEELDEENKTDTKVNDNYGYNLVREIGNLLGFKDVVVNLDNEGSNIMEKSSLSNNDENVLSVSEHLTDEEKKSDTTYPTESDQGDGNETTDSTADDNNDDSTTDNINNDDSTDDDNNNDDSTTDNTSNDESTTVNINNDSTDDDNNNDDSTTVNSNDDSTTDNTNNDDSTTDNTNNDDSTTDNTNNDDSTTDNTNNDDSTTDNTNNDDSTTVNSNDDSTTDNTNNDDSTTEITNNDESTTVNSNDDSTTDNTNNDDSTTVNTNNDDSTTDNTNDDSTTDNTNDDNTTVNNNAGVNSEVSSTELPIIEPKIAEVPAEETISDGNQLSGPPGQFMNTQP